MFTEPEIKSIREQFPALERTENGNPVIYFDGPAGSQTPTRVAKAVSDYMLHTNANGGGAFVTSRESDALLNEAQDLAATFFGATEPESIVFGPNMTSLTFVLSRSLATTWNEGDEIILSRLDHDANVTPWVIAAEAAGVRVHHIDLHAGDCTLNLADFESKLNERTRLVAVGYASNATGTVNPIEQIVAKAHAVGAQVFVDAVHLAPHRLIDVNALGCDFLVASAYKFFGPHVGVLWGRRELLESIPAYKVRPAYDTMPDRWMTGTPNLEGIMGSAEAIRYLADLGASRATGSDLRSQLQAAFEAIQNYESMLLHRLLEGLRNQDGIRIWGITQPDQLHNRVPTISLTHTRRTPKDLAQHLADKGIFVWSGHHYAVPFTEAVDLEPDGTLRIGLLHYNTIEEIERLLTELRAALV